MSWNLRKTLQFFGIIAFAIAISFLLVKSTRVEAQQQIEKSGPRLQLQDVSNNLNGWSGDILTFCDTANGNLIYVLVGSDKGGMVVAPNNCHKNPR